LEAGLRTDPLGELQRSPRLPSRNRAEVLLLRGKEGRGGKMDEEEEKREEGVRGIASSLFNFWLRACSPMAQLP